MAVLADSRRLKRARPLVVLLSCPGANFPVTSVLLCGDAPRKHSGLHVANVATQSHAGTQSCFGFSSLPAKGAVRRGEPGCLQPERLNPLVAGQMHLTVQQLLEPGTRLGDNEALKASKPRSVGSVSVSQDGLPGLTAQGLTSSWVRRLPHPTTRRKLSHRA